MAQSGRQEPDCPPLIADIGFIQPGPAVELVEVHAFEHVRSATSMFIPGLALLRRALLRRDFEDRAIAVCPSSVRRAVEIAVTGLD